MKTLSIYKTQTQIEKQTRETDSRHRRQTREREADKDHPLHKPLSSTIPARAKVDLVPIECGQWVLVYVEHFMPDPGELRTSLERLINRGSGWDCLVHGRQQFEVLKVERIMPKTIKACGKPARYPRVQIVAASNSREQIAVLRDKLFAIGVEVGETIERERIRVMADFTAKTHADALAKVHAALPHIFGRGA